MSNTLGLPPHSSCRRASQPWTEASHVQFCLWQLMVWKHCLSFPVWGCTEDGVGFNQPAPQLGLTWR